MQKSALFNKTRLQIAAWYASGTGTILLLASLYFYFMIRGNYWSGINREVATLAGTLHDTLEPKLQEPGIISEGVEREVIPNLCVTGKPCRPINDSQRHNLGITQQGVYYLRFYNLQQQVVAQSGVQPMGAIDPDLGAPWQSIHDRAGQHFHLFSTSLTTADGRPWGFLQVGRSMQEFDERLTNLQLRVALVLPFFMLFTGVVSWWIAGRTMKPIYSSYQKMQQFTADAAHELRTPLMALQVTVELMQYYQPSDYLQQKESLTALDRQLQRLIRLAQDLLLLSRLDSPIKQLSPASACCLQQAVPPLVSNLQSLSQGAGVHLTVDLRTAISLAVRIDRLDLERLVTNLVANAVEHTPVGGTVTVILDRRNSWAILQVADTGVGMSAEVQEHIFDRFYRASRDRGRKSGGAGLGLAIVQSIVHCYGGSVTVKSQLQSGSTFTIELPLSID